MSYTELRLEATNNHTIFKVRVKGWFGIWKSAFVFTDYFLIQYSSRDEAVKAIEGYKNRYTEAKQ